MKLKCYTDKQAVHHVEDLLDSDSWADFISKWYFYAPSSCLLHGDKTWKDTKARMFPDD